MEIERKYLISEVPGDLNQYTGHHIEQGYLCTNPVVRVRKEDNNYFLTFKGSGLMAREEINIPLTEEGYAHLRAKIDGQLISKYRYNIPLSHPHVKEGSPEPPKDYSLLIELDVFEPPFAPLFMAEVEFGSVEAAEAFLPPAWFGADVTYCPQYHNSYMAMHPDGWQTLLCNSLNQN
jgi:CYTH domain-containing protein